MSACKRERHDVGLEAVDHGAGLLAGAAMGLLDGDGLAGLGLPILDEGLVDGLVELAGRIVGDVEKGGVGKHGARRKVVKIMAAPAARVLRSLVMTAISSWITP